MEKSFAFSKTFLSYTRFFIGYWILKRGRISIWPLFLFYTHQLTVGMAYLQQR
jgi:hypothetical protein